MFSHGKHIALLQYFTDKVDDYWHILYPLTEPRKRKADPFLYFYDISRKATDFGGPFSDGGIYLFKGYDGQWHIHALEISQYALACWLAWRKTKEQIWLERALLHCDWLVENQEESGAWRIGHKNPIYSDMPDPWPSAMAQGLAVSALLRAYRATDKTLYLESAKKAALFLELDVDKGGVRRRFEKEEIEGFIYEEYPRKELSGVLNGYISAVLGVCELSEFESDFRVLCNKNIENLLHILSLYDTGFWSYYSLDGNIASGFYHRYVVIQLAALEGVDPSFSKLKKLYASYTDCRICAFRALISKLRRIR